MFVYFVSMATLSCGLTMDGRVCRLGDQWRRSLLQGTDFDRWGQPVEATNIYFRLSREIATAIVDKNTQLTPEQNLTCGQLVAALDSRIESLKQPSNPHFTNLESLQQYESKLNILIRPTSSRPRTPLVPTAIGRSLTPTNLIRCPSPRPDSSGMLLLHDMRWSLQGTLLPQPSRQSGKTYVRLKIEKIGLKNADEFMDPFITISVKDGSGCDLLPQQNTPPATVRHDRYLAYDANVHIQRPLDDLPPDFAIFFEFKHYKIRKHKISTRCFAFLERDEIRKGSAALELYKKPTDVFRENLKLMTTKSLFLHLHISCDKA